MRARSLNLRQPPPRRSSLEGITSVWGHQRNRLRAGPGIALAQGEACLSEQFLEIQRVHRACASS